MRKHFGFLILCTVFLLSLTACGKQETEGTTTAADNDAGNDYVYVPEFIKFGSEGNNYYGTMMIDGNFLYYNQGEYDADAATYVEKLYAYSLEDGSQKEVPMQITGDRNISRFCIDEAGSLYAVLCDYSKGETSEDGYVIPELFLNKYDAQGNMTLDKDITGVLKQYGADYVNNMAVDEEGNFYLGLNDAVLLFNAEGEERGIIEVNASWISGLKTGKNGKVYFGYYDNNSNGEMVLSEIDFSRKGISNTYKNIPGVSGDGLTVGNTGNFLMNDGSKVYEYDLATQTYEEILAWTDCNVFGTNVQGISVTEDGTIVALVRDWEAGSAELVRLTATDPSEIEEVQEIVIAALYNDQALQEAVVAFNKANDKYRATIKTYISGNNWDSDTYNDARTRLQNDIISNTNCPDIINLSDINEEAYIEKGVFVDLYPYLEKSSVISEEDFFENILEGFTYNGELLSMPNTFYISTVVGKTSVVGGEMGWTLEDMIALSEKHPDALCFDGMDRNSALYYCMLYNQDSFIDWEKGECYFNTDDFKRILDFVNQFPGEIDWQTYTGQPDVADLKSEQVLLNTVTVGNIPDLQLSAGRFDDEVTFIGFPTTDGSVGCELASSARYGITAKCSNKEGAWAFLESYLTNTSDNSGATAWGFPTLKSKFEEIAADYLSEPWGTHTVTMGDGWSYTYHRPTKEEIDLIRELIAVGNSARTFDENISKILFEEADAYFSGQKPLDEIVDIIQNRVQIYMSEKSVN